MKKTAFALVFSILYLVFRVNTIHAQDFNAQKAYSDYQYQLSLYQEGSSEFQDAKTFYTKNPTLQLKEDVRQKTLKMLKGRDQLVIAYLTAIRMQIVESTGFDDVQKGAIFSKIDSEVTWYQNHIKSYSDNDELISLFSKSDESKARYQDTTTLIIDEGLFDIGLSQEIGLRISHQRIYSDLKNYINDQVAVGKLRMDPFNRWINDTDLVLQTLQKNETDGATKIQSLYSQNYAINSMYESAIGILNTSVDPLSQLNSYLTEMLASIKNQLQ